VIEVLVFILLIIFAFIWTRLRKQRVGGIDNFLDLKWLFPSRNRKIQFEEINSLMLKRGVCGNFGKVSPWTNRPCKCTGYTFKRHRRGVAYCECGCQMIGHKFKMPIQSSPPPLDNGDPE